jgi:hypothetical protein
MKQQTTLQQSIEQLSTLLETYTGYTYEDYKYLEELEAEIKSKLDQSGMEYI